jgi:hypothetical protein
MKVVRTLVALRTPAFNTSQEKETFLNPGNFGDDLASWIAERLRLGGHAVDNEIGQEDHGWYLTFVAGDQSYDFIIGYREDDEWIGWIERSCGLFASLLGGRHRGMQPAGPLAIHAAVSEPRVTSIAWHYEKAFRRGDESGSAPLPTDP